MAPQDAALLSGLVHSLLQSCCYGQAHLGQEGMSHAVAVRKPAAACAVAQAHVQEDGVYLKQPPALSKMRLTKGRQQL